MADQSYGDSRAETADRDRPQSNGEMLTRIREDWRRDIDAVREQRRKQEDDLYFVAYDQWDPKHRKWREDRGLPCLEMDETGQMLRQVEGDIRLNKPAIRALPADEGADPGTAKVFNGLIRSIEAASDATGAYAQAAVNATICGEGAFRITTRYASDDVFDQDIVFERIPNALAVMWDRDAIEPTRKDANHVTIRERYSKAKFQARWPNASLEDFENHSDETWHTDWYDGDFVWVAEYWCKKPVQKTLVRLTDKRVMFEEDWEAEKAKAEADTYEIARTRDAAYMELAPPPPQAEVELTRTVDTHGIWRYTCNGSEILETYEWPGRHIPIVAVMGEEFWVAEKRIRRGIVRRVKDPQRMVNFHASTAVEITALAPKSPWVGTATMFEGHEREYEQAHREGRAWLPYNADAEAPGLRPERQPGAEPPVALLQLMQTASLSVQKAAGIYNSSVSAPSPETSGVAIQRREAQADVGTYLYADNLSKSIQRAGEIMIDLIPKIYDGDRVVRVLGEDDAEDMVRINAIQPDRSVRYDMTAGKYDVLVRQGPSFSTKRQEAAQGLREFVRDAPTTAALFIDLIAKAQDWPYSDEIYERLRKHQIAQNIIPPDPEKGERAPPPPGPTPEMVEAETNRMESEVDMAKKTAETEAQKIENARAALELALSQGVLQDIVARQVTQQVAATLAQFAAGRPPIGPVGP